MGGFWIFVLFQKGFLTSYLSSESGKANVSQSFSHSDNSVKNSENFHIFNSSKVKKTYSLISDYFYGFDKKTQEELENGMISALVNSLWDKHSEYFTAEENEEFQSDLKWDFQGIGAVVGEDILWAKIERVLKDSPAEKSGLLAWDIVMEVNGKSIAGMSTTEAVKLIRWEKWTAVEISYLRENVPTKISIIRDSVNIPSVDGKMLENNIAYIQVNTFGEKTPREFADYVKKLKDEWAKGFILDFRFNGGGFLTSAQSILGHFLPRNSKIVTMKENNPANNITLSTGLLSFSDTNTPMVVLVNEFSASASEIVAGAIGEYKRGIIVGTKTYGKGSVQEMFPLSDGSMVKLTVARWYTPNDKNIDEEGIIPDVIVEIQKEDYQNAFDRQKKSAENIVKSLIEGKSREEIIKNPENFIAK